VATLKEIGTALGLSPATVSRALNGFPEVNAETRARVEETAREMNYRPNQIARKLVSGRSGMAALVMKPPRGGVSDPEFFEFMSVISARLSEHDIDLIFRVGFDRDEVTPYERLVEKNTVDGFFLNAPTLGDPRIDFLRKSKIPFVVHGKSDGTVDYPFFDVDNRKAAASSVGLLCDLGHRRIALINGPANYAFASERLRGFSDCLAARGLSVPAKFTPFGPATEDHGYVATLTALGGTMGLAPTAFVCASTAIAAGACRAIKDKGLRIPHDISIIAHDDAIPHMRAVSFEPALTVTWAPFRDACAPLADMLVARLAGTSVEDLQETVLAELIVRGSTGPVPPEGAQPWQ